MLIIAPNKILEIMLLYTTIFLCITIVDNILSKRLRKSSSAVSQMFIARYVNAICAPFGVV
jgi:hypothetical protein